MSIIVGIAVAYYHNPADGMTHADVYLDDGGVMQWSGHLVMSRVAWQAFGGLLVAGSDHSTACQVQVRESWRWDKKEAN